MYSGSLDRQDYSVLSPQSLAGTFSVLDEEMRYQRLGQYNHPQIALLRLLGNFLMTSLVHEAQRIHQLHSILVVQSFASALAAGNLVQKDIQ